MTFNPDGIERELDHAVLNKVIKATLNLNPDLELSKDRLTGLFVTIMCLLAEYFYENSTKYFTYGFFRAYKPDGIGKFFTWEVLPEKLGVPLSELNRETIGENALIKEFKKQLIEFLKTLCRCNLKEEAPINDTLARINRRKLSLETTKKKEKKNGD